jgi:hypothetical protein
MPKRQPRRGLERRDGKRRRTERTTSRPREGQPAAGSVRCGGQGVHQDRDGARLRHIIGYVKGLSLNNARIASLVEQLYSINKRLVAHESRLMRLADSFGVPRQHFIDEYFGNELE